MTRHKGGPTVNTGGAGKPDADEAAAGFDIAGNAKEKGERPSPGARERGETSSADAAAPVDLADVRDRAS
ncbi:MAG: hypothetical protein QOH81_1637 [Sphingomonadales bacterium]|jgi:hypothetical protein|nr:hypothetical protein [Sphingomonadales bacterium]